MREVGVRGMAAALVLGLGAAIAAAGQPDSDAKAGSHGLLADLFVDKAKEKAAADKAAVEEKTAAPRSAEEVAAEQQRHMNAILRRMEVCDRLRTIALQSGNEELLRQADELEARARDLYRRQIAQLPLPAVASEKPIRPAADKPVSRQASRKSGTRDRDLDEFTPAPSRRPMSGMDRLGGDFAARERDILNGTSMGRDKP